MTEEILKWKSIEFWACKNNVWWINCCDFSVRASHETNEVPSDLYAFQECDKNNICFVEVFAGPKYIFEIVYIYWKHPVAYTSPSYLQQFEPVTA